MSKQSIHGTDEAWDERLLGAEEDFIKVAEDDIEDGIDDSVGLQMISIRLQKALIEDFKLIASLNGLGYQTLMRQIMQRFADCEKKRLLRELVADRHALQQKASTKKQPIEPQPKQRKAA